MREITQSLARNYALSFVVMPAVYRQLILAIPLDWCIRWQALRIRFRGLIGIILRLTSSGNVIIVVLCHDVGEALFLRLSRSSVCPVWCFLQP